MMSIEDADTFVHGQFLRIQSYARVASKKAQQVENARAAKKGKPPKTIWNSSEVIAEALRDEGACGHVKAPEPPTFHYGDEKRMRGLVAELDGYANAIHARTGKRLRKDTAHMLAGVLSYPDDAPKDRYPEWRARSIKWLKKRYGRHLVAVLEHLDENNPHLHFYAIEPKGLDVKAIHEGWTAKKDGQDYRDAMRLVQDDYHRDVSAWVGLTRIGPGRKRLERDEYMAMKADAEQTRTMLRDIEAQSNKANDTLQKASRAGLEAQQMGATMLQKAKQRAEAIGTTAQAQAQKNKDEARRLHEEKQRLQDWADQLKMSAEKIAKNTGHLVTIEVPSAPAAALVNEAMVPGANAPGSPGRSALVPSATPSPFDKPPGF